jgi:putative glycosyltransferase
MKLSIVTTLYHSAEYIHEFHARSTRVAQEFAGQDYEIIMVNDGSPDNSLDVATPLAQTDPHLVIVNLSRNFGHHKALMTGLAQSRGDYVFLIDSDLEEEPEWLLPFSKQLQAEQCDVVYGIQEKRKGGLFERYSGQWFYKLFNALTSLNLPMNMATARLMTRPYVNALLQHQERELFIPGIWHITGYIQKEHKIKKHSISESTYTLKSKLAMLVNAVTSFSNTPLKSIFYLGILISVMAGIYTLYLCINWLFFSTPLMGWTSVMASIWLLGGLIISFIGVIGIYLSKIFSETKQRPYTLIKEIITAQPRER